MLSIVPVVLLLFGCFSNKIPNEYREIKSTKSINLKESKQVNRQSSFSKTELGLFEILDVHFSGSAFHILSTDAIYTSIGSKNKMLNAKYKKIKTPNSNCAGDGIFHFRDRFVLTRNNRAQILSEKSEKLSLVKEILFSNNILRVFESNNQIIFVLKNGNISSFSSDGVKLWEFNLNLTFSPSSCDLDQYGNVLITDSEMLYKINNGKVVDFVQLGRLGKMSGVLLVSNRILVFGNNAVTISDLNGKNFRRYEVKDLYTAYVFGNSVILVTKDGILIGNPDNIYTNGDFATVESVPGIIGVNSGNTISLFKKGIYASENPIISQGVTFAKMDGDIMVIRHNGAVSVCKFEGK